MNYVDRLKNSAEESGSIVSLGLDPVLPALPFPELEPDQRLIQTFSLLFTEMKRKKILPGAFKPNLGFYQRLDAPRDGKFPGSRALAGIMDMLKEMFPGIPVILDYKRGDIAASSENYAAEGFDCWKADAVTVAPYMGRESVLPFLKAAEKRGGGCYVLNRTSNAGAAEFQNLPVSFGEGGGRGTEPLYLAVAGKITSWAEEIPGTGAVVGATSLNELEDLARFYARFDDIPLLIPGVGGQGGDASSVLNVLKKTGYPLRVVRINSSSGITHPWHKGAEAGKKSTAPGDWIEKSLKALNTLNAEIGWR